MFDTYSDRSPVPKYVAIKLQKSAHHYTEAAYDEIELLTVVHKRSEHRVWSEHFLDLNVSFDHMF